MAIRTELSVKLQNSPGSVARACQALADERISLVALSLDEAGTLRCVVDNHVHAKAVLEAQHYEVGEREVLYAVMPNRAGSLAAVMKMVADGGVNLDYVYASGAEDSPTVGVVLGVPDPMRASAAAGI